MSNTKKIEFTGNNEGHGSGRDTQMQAWLDYQQALVASRTRELEADAAATRLAAAAIDAHGPSIGLRGRVGAVLIRAGEALAQERMPSRPSHHRPHAAA